MRIAREAPANPEVTIYHTDRALTDAIVETYAHGAGSRPPLAAAILSVPGIRQVSIIRYKVRVTKGRGTRWEIVLPSVDRAVLTSLGGSSVETTPRDEDHRTFRVRARAPLPRAVYEGAGVAEEHPLSDALFSLDGVAEVILDGDEVHVRKGRLFSWPALEPKARAAIERFEKREQSSGTE